jgi:hypothetical protein
MFVAVAGLPADPSAMREAAVLCGLTPMEVGTRCAGALPRILVRQAGEDEARRQAAGLGALGFLAFAADARQVDGDAQRVVARQLEWTDAGCAVMDGRGTRHDCPFAGIVLIQAGFRTATLSEIVKSTERKFSMGKALLSGGLALTRKVETVSEQVTSTRETFILVQRRPDQPAIILYESRLGFQCLGADLRHTRQLNLKALLERLRAQVPAPVDDRAAQPAFLRGLPRLGVDEVDLGLFLVREARQLGS